MSGIEGALIAAGVSAAVGVGSSLLIQALTPTPTVKRGGLGDLSVPKSSYNTTIPRCWGNVKVGGILMHSAAKREITNTRRTGGKNSPRVEETTYLGSFAVLFAHTPYRSAEKLSRLWLNNQLVFDADSTDPDTIEASAQFAAEHMRFYTGAFDQPIDPFLKDAIPIQAFDYGLPHDPAEREAALANLGLPTDRNHALAYLWKCYLVLENLDLTPYGGKLPAVKAEILFNSDNSVATIVRDLCYESGRTNIDVSDLENIFCPGFYLDSQQPAKQALTTLQQAYQLDIIKRGKTLVFERHSKDRPVTEIALDDLAAHTFGSARPSTYTLPKPDPRDLPRSVEVNYIDQDGSHEPGNVIARSTIATSKRKESYNFPIVMTAASAQSIADKLLHKFYLQAIKIPGLSLQPKYGFLEVGDRISYPVEGEYYTLQITKIKTGANRLLKVDAVVIEDALSSTFDAEPVPVADGGYTQPQTGSTTIRVAGLTTLQILDINKIEDSDTDLGVYAAAYGGANWREASIYVSTDDVTYTFVDTIARNTVGTLRSAMNETSNTFDVELDSGELVSVTSGALAQGLNKILVGNEIMQFSDRVLSGEYDRLSNLVRGLRGTPITNHAIGERVVLLTGESASLTRLPIRAEDIGQTRYFKAPSFGQSLEDAQSVAVVIEGNALKPYSPINATATVDSANNISLSWQRRDRNAGDATNYDNLPLSETNERYELEIMNGNTIRRSESTTNTFYFYSRANQITDFGSPRTDVTIRIYQLSATVGRGYVGEFLVTPNFAESAPQITGFSPASAQVGDTVTVTGFALSNFTDLTIGGISQSGLAVISDEEITFVIAESTITGTVKIFTPGGTATSSNAIIIERSNALAVPKVTGLLFTSGNIVVDESYFGKVLLHNPKIDGQDSDVTITLTESLANQDCFTFTVVNLGTAGKKITIIPDDEQNTFVEGKTELTKKGESVQMFYVQGFDYWICI